MAAENAMIEILLEGSAKALLCFKETRLIYSPAMEKQADSVTGSLSVVQNGCRVIFQRKEWCKECVVGIGK